MSFDERFYPLSQSEYGIYYECRNGTTAYNLPLLFPLAGFDREKLLAGVKTFFELHPCLFTRFALDEDGNVKKHIVKTGIDVGYFEAESVEKVPVTHFEMLESPLYRVAFCRVGGEEYLFCDFHHAIFDGASTAMFLRDVLRICDGESLLPERKDANGYALWEAEERASPRYEEAKNYFASAFGGSECSASVPEDKKDEKVCWKSYKKPLGVTRDEVSAFVKKTGCKTSSLFLAAFGYLLSRMNMEHEALFSTVQNGRNAENEGAAGMFVRTVPFRLNFPNGAKIKDILLEATEEQIKLAENRVYSFADATRDLGISSDVIFAYQGDYFCKTVYHGKELGLIQPPVEDGKSGVTAEVYRDGDGFFFRCEYRADLYTDFTAESILRLYGIILKEFMRRETLDETDITGEAELAVLDAQNESPGYAPDTEHTVIDYFEKHAKEQPEHPLVSFGDRTYTYAGADAISASLAAKLSSLGIGREDVVSVLIAKSEYIVLASLGVLRAGAAYQPLDPSYPVERLEFMVKDSAAKALILDRKYESLLPDFAGAKIYTDEIPSLPAAPAPDKRPRPEDLFILLYTSGTTGKPKGVMLEHGSLLNFSLMCNERYAEGPDMKTTAYASYGFDADMMDIYPAITAGGCVFVIPEDMRLDLMRLGEYMNECGITHSIITTQVGRQVAQELELKTMRHFFVGGEKLVPLAPPAGYVMHNAYGPTEGTVFCSEQPLDGLYYRVPIGKHIPGCKFYILDENGRRLPRGIKGELCISGRGVARGYLNRDEENKKAFVKNPFESEKPFERMYRTGDIVRFLEDGALDFIGRNDGQVKIRGFRVELTEVEQIIREFPGIKDATVKDFTDPSGMKFIAAYVVSDSPVDTAALSAFIAGNKPPYMVPPFIIQIDKIPLNQNQKVNKRALPEPVLQKREAAAPETEAEKRVFTILSEILGYDSFGVTDDIYEAGLTSVSSIRFAVKLQKAFGRPFRTADLESNPTVRALALAAQEGREEKERGLLSEYPLTKTQEGIFIESISSPGGTGYNIPVLFRLADGIIPEKLCEAVKKALAAHPYALSRLSTDENGDVVIKREENAPEAALIKAPLPADLKTLVRPFDLIGKKLYRAEIYDTGNGVFLFMDLHHIICDGSGLAVLLQDISGAYAGEEPEKETCSGYEIALDEREERAKPAFGEAKKYFAGLLAEADGDYLPKKSLKPGERKQEAKESVSACDLAETKRFVKENGLTLDSLCNFLFGYMLAGFNYRGDALYASVYNGRDDARTANAVSMLVKTLPVYVKFNPEDDFAEAVAALKKQIEASRRNSVYSFSEAAADHGITANVLFAYQGDAFTFDELCGGKAELTLLDSDEPKSALTLQVSIKDGAFALRFEYDASVYNSDAADSFMRAYETLLCSAVKARKVGDLKMLSARDEAMYAEFGKTFEPIPEVPFNKLFEAQAERVPQKTAVIASDGEYTYKELNETANRIAHGLIASGVTRGGRVAVLMPRVRDAYAARQAVLKTGAAFIPIDPKYPDERIAYILENSGAQAAVSTAELLRDKKGSFRGAAALDIEALKQTNNCENPDVPAEQTDLSYIIYTSGSTGKPKGVMITHRNLVNLCLDGSNLTTLIHRRGGDIVSGSFASLAFDASIFEEAIPLSHGYTAVIASEEEIENPLLYADMMIRYGVNMSFFTPSYVSNVLDCPPFVKALRNFKAMMMGAEAVPPELVQKLRDAGVTAEIYDGYGPTETTVACTFHRVTDKYVTIGKPVANTNIYILGTRGEIMPIGALGELTIAGECVGDGYLGMPEKTAEKFIEINGVKAFRSGDLARINAEGNVEFYGRLDNQVKLHGLRIELDEIEKAITAYPGVSRAVVAVLKSETEGDYLCGYFTAGTQIDRAKLTEFISASLTHYMVPKVLIQLEKMPLTPNGKIDKKALPEPKIEAPQRNITKPANETEAKITAIFAKALGTKEFGADENFFDRGGTSLSASKVAMLAMGQGLNIAYKDVFEFPTAQLLAKHISAAGGEESPEAAEEGLQNTEKALEYNVNRFADEATDTRPLGRTLLTGATGFLGSHVLKELLERGVETVVLCRGSAELDARTRLSAMAAYYFDSPLDEELDKYAKIIDGDITEPGLALKLADERINTVINCAACVKHFAKDDIIERINVGGVKNVIKLAEEKHARLVQISTLSVAGENVDNKFPPAFRMFENQLYFGQDISNKYVNSKFMAEKAVIEAAERGLDAKIIRVGNLMGRQSDGEFQINNITNSFIRSLKAYKALGCFPVSSCDTTVDFSPIDEVAKAVILLSTAGAKLTVFHCANAHEVQMGDVIEAMNRYGFEIKIVSDAEFSARLGEMMKDDSRGMLVSSLLTYSSGDRHVRSYIKTDNAFSIKALYRLGYKWPITDGDYLLRVIESLDSLNYFDREDI